MAYLAAFGLTQVVEAPLYVVLLAVAARVRPSRALMASVVVNLVSHPLFSFVFLPLARQLVGFVPGVAIAEGLVWVLESAMLMAWRRRDLLMIAAVALFVNASSFAAGLVALR